MAAAFSNTTAEKIQNTCEKNLYSEKLHIKLTTSGKAYGLMSLFTNVYLANLLTNIHKNILSIRHQNHQPQVCIVTQEDWS